MKVLNTQITDRPNIFVRAIKYLFVVMQLLSSEKMYMAIRFQIFEEHVCISYSINTLMNPTIFPSAMYIIGQTGLFNLFIPTSLGKEIL